MSEHCWNYCSVCGRKIPVGEKCYGVNRSSSALMVGESICKDCIEPENFEIPASNVRPVVRGRWRWVGQDKWNDCYECSQCGKMNTDNSNFCPNCGADMRGE